MTVGLSTNQSMNIAEYHRNQIIEFSLTFFFLLCLIVAYISAISAITF